MYLALSSEMQIGYGYSFCFITMSPLLIPLTVVSLAVAHHLRFISDEEGAVALACTHLNQIRPVTLVLRAVRNTGDEGGVGASASLSHLRPRRLLRLLAE